MKPDFQLYTLEEAKAKVSRTKNRRSAFASTAASHSNGSESSRRMVS